MFLKKDWEGRHTLLVCKGVMAFRIRTSGFTGRPCRYTCAWQKPPVWFQQRGSRSLEVAQGEVSSRGFQQNTMTEHVGEISFWCVSVPFPLLHLLHPQNSSCLFLAEEPQLDWWKMSFFALLIFARRCMADRLWCVLWKKKSKYTPAHVHTTRCVLSSYPNVCITVSPGERARFSDRWDHDVKDAGD